MEISPTLGVLQARADSAYSSRSVSGLLLHAYRRTDCCRRSSSSLRHRAPRVPFVDGRASTSPPLPPPSSRSARPGKAGSTAAASSTASCSSCRGRFPCRSARRVPDAESEGHHANAMQGEAGSLRRGSPRSRVALEGVGERDSLEEVVAAVAAATGSVAAASAVGVRADGADGSDEDEDGFEFEIGTLGRFMKPQVPHSAARPLVFSPPSHASPSNPRPLLSHYTLTAASRPSRTRGLSSRTTPSPPHSAPPSLPHPRPSPPWDARPEALPPAACCSPRPPDALATPFTTATPSAEAPQGSRHCRAVRRFWDAVREPKRFTEAKACGGGDKFLNLPNLVSIGRMASGPLIGCTHRVNIGKERLWLKLPVDRSKFVPVALKVLVVQEKYRDWVLDGVWKLPTGFIQEVDTSAQSRKF
ncbi:hypothetical protein ZWY2020_058960 [Hordeum vulgare]|nr:hypothetical protein ZWY2020_058960 [Hordeum vulgare]